MAVFKCKMCGGSLEFESGATVGVCDSCGTKQTLPDTSNDLIANLYVRANNLRLKNEFDRAQKVYEDIIGKDDAQAEAHWGVVLCKYGIEYVEDPETHKRLPTCHRASYEAIRSDVDYQAAVDYADGAQQALYEAEALVIDRTQKRILEIAKDEEPFDVFICYKETDENGKRTVDSTIANDIYYQLTQAGYKVFYAAITLEDKLGQEYEPYIFAALNSAKVMLVIGTRPEFFNAVWVKNEWSRYLKLIRNDRSKLLIPCYRDMDAYDLPEEFAHLQAQDMSKIGFINDVVRGIRKVIGKEKSAQTTQQAQPLSNESGNVTALLERGFLALEDKEWSRADEFFEQALNFDAKNARAYLGKLMVQLTVSSMEDIGKASVDLTSNANYSKVIRFGDDKLIADIKKQIERASQNYHNQFRPAYEAAIMKLQNANSISDYEQLKQEFASFGDLMDSKEFIKKCNDKIEWLKSNNGHLKIIFENDVKEKSFDIEIDRERIPLGKMPAGSVLNYTLTPGTHSIHFNNYYNTLPYKTTIVRDKTTVIHFKSRWFDNKIWEEIID